MAGHLLNDHSADITEEQLPLLLTLSERPVDEDAIFGCPLCPDELYLNRLDAHIAEHLEEISLFALPTGEDENMGLSESSIASNQVEKDSGDRVHQGRDFNSVTIIEDNFDLPPAIFDDEIQSKDTPLQILGSSSGSEIAVPAALESDERWAGVFQKVKPHLPQPDNDPLLLEWRAHQESPTIISGATIATTHWAVLIGISFDVSQRGPKGSVRDVEAIKQYLQAGPTPVGITILTATPPTDPNSTLPLETPDLWPTYENVISSLSRVLQEANSGNFVYIHYSGFSTRMSDGRLALVLFDKYLWDGVLIKCLRKMVKKGLLVTLVLDCSYSGSFPYGSDRMLLNPIDPNGYTILSACGPHEVAQEIETKGGEHMGALTFFLLQTLVALRERGMEITHQSLYQHLWVRFHEFGQRQAPMRCGNRNLTFFGNLGATPDSTLVPVYRTEDGFLRLSVGQAHGVYMGDEYALYPLNHPEGATNQTSVIARVVAVWGLTSELEVETETAAKRITTEWKAKPIACLSPQKICVRLMANVGSKLEWKDSIEQQQHFLLLSVEDEETVPCMFNLTLNTYNKYEILDSSYQRIVNLPTVPLNTHGASEIFLNVLQHLAMFKYFERIENRMPSRAFEESFLLLPTCDAGLSGSFDVKHGDTWDFVIENVGSRPLYMVIFNLSPLWRVFNPISAAGRGEFMVIPPKGILDSGRQNIQLKMKVPKALQSCGISECKDIVKVFVTSKSTFFPSEVLPEMPLDAAGLSSRVRGSGDQPSRLLPQLTTSSRGQGSNAGLEARDENWACQNFFIRTYM